jgi:WD40 repeat protein
VDIWERGTWQTVYAYQAYSGVVAATITAIAWSPDSQRVAAADSNSGVYVWDALTGNNSYLFSAHAPEADAVAWSHKGDFIASGTQQGSVQVWSLGTTGGPLYTYAGHRAAVRAVAWSPDGPRIASASMDGSVQIWDALTGTHVVSYRQP